MIIPGVQNPHCRASWSTNACCTGCSLPSFAKPSMVVLFPFHLGYCQHARSYRFVIDNHGAGAAYTYPAAELAPVSPNWSRKTHKRVRVGSRSFYLVSVQFKMNHLFHIRLV
jgi:hypothetical protein